MGKASTGSGRPTQMRIIEAKPNEQLAIDKLPRALA